MTESARSDRSGLTARCRTHLREPIGTCARCEQFVCELDARERDDVLVCDACAKSPAGRSSKKAKREWRPFEEARAFAHALKLENHLEWVDWSKGKTPSKGTRPWDIPSDPARVYLEVWQGWGDWLGTGVLGRNRTWRSFEEARAFARGLGLNTWAEWIRFAKGELPETGRLPTDVPAAPQNAYADDWKGIGDWLGTNRVAWIDHVFRPFGEARAFVRALGLKSFAEWRDYSSGRRPDLGARPSDVPGNPPSTYRGAWKGWGDWLGTGALSYRNRDWRPFEKAREFARSLGLTTAEQWVAFAKGEFPEKGVLPTDIPANPRRVYTKSGFRNMADWLGVDRRRGPYLPFEKAREVVRSLGLATIDEWRACAAGEPGLPELPDGIPGSPHKTYERQWKSWYDWLGKPEVRWLPFEEGRAFARTLGLKTTGEWHAFCLGKLPEKGTLPHDVPSKPERIYAETGWAGIPDWLGTMQRAPRKRWRPFREARDFVRALGLPSASWWRRYCSGLLPTKKPDDIPSAPHLVYRDEWTSWGDWLRNEAAVSARATGGRERRGSASAREGSAKKRQKS